VGADVHSFEGRVAVVTGAGRGIGRAYALLLAGRGARVVVNDLGGSMQGLGADAGVASHVATEIAAAGGSAIADENDVAAPSGAQALIDAAVDNFGRIDILVNNAGIIQWAGLPDVDQENLERHLSVHVLGSFNTTRAAWPHMVEQGYGRIVMTTSSGIFGLPKNLSYATAKGGVIGLTRSIATMSESHGIKVNLIAPAAMTRMAGPGADPDDATSPMAPGQVAPLVAFLAHEACPVNGEMYAAGAGRFARIFIASTPGYVVADPSIEDVAEHWDEINDDEGYVVPRDLPDWSSSFLAHLQAER
jgi:NAD(P)-dependent dehydrogenase (short-subunit alcohol dehydrogenase family)